MLGGALSYPENESPLLAPIAGRSYQDKLKIFGAIALVGFILFMLFYSSCRWSLDYCGFLGVSKGKDWAFAILSGWMLGFGMVGLAYAYLNRSDDYGPSGGPGYNPMATTQPAISMI